MLEVWIVMVFAMLIITAMAGVLWLFIAKEALVEGWLLSFQEFFQNTPFEDKQGRSYVRYRRAIRSGQPVREEEFSALPKYMRNDRLRKAVIASMGIFYAATIGLFGGFVLFVFARASF